MPVEIQRLEFVYIYCVWRAYYYDVLVLCVHGSGDLTGRLDAPATLHYWRVGQCG